MNTTNQIDYGVDWHKMNYRIIIRVEDNYHIKVIRINTGEKSKKGLINFINTHNKLLVKKNSYSHNTRECSPTYSVEKYIKLNEGAKSALLDFIKKKMNNK